MRTNHAGVTEVASLRTDKEKYDEGWDRVFGKKEFVKQEDVPNKAAKVIELSPEDIIRDKDMQLDEYREQVKFLESKCAALEDAVKELQEIITDGKFTKDRLE